jgi:hypothetical protein
VLQVPVAFFFEDGPSGRRVQEARGANPITSSAVTIRRVQVALKALGIEFLNHTQLGVRLRIHRMAPQNGWSIKSHVEKVTL